MATCPLCGCGALRIIAVVIQEMVITRSRPHPQRTAVSLHEVSALADDKDPFAPLRRSCRSRVRLSHVELCRGALQRGLWQNSVPSDCPMAPLRIDAMFPCQVVMQGASIIQLRGMAHQGILSEKTARRFPCFYRMSRLWSISRNLPYTADISLDFQWYRETI